MLIDPEGGWKYGFPKEYDGEKPISHLSDFELAEWLVEKGYPLKEVGYWFSNGRSVPCRFMGD